MNVFVVYCHPSENSFTSEVKNSFLQELKDAGHHYVISDLYLNASKNAPSSIRGR